MLQIPSGTHSGSWDRIQDMLTISSAPPAATLLSLSLLLLSTTIIPKAATWLLLTPN